MALVIETGAVVPGANSWVTLAEIDAYHTARGTAGWIAIIADPTREVFALKAAQQMEVRYRTMWHGKKAGGSQPMSWPRINVYDEDGYEIPINTVPQLVKNAQCEVAELIRAGSSLVQAEVSASQASVSSESVGPISISYGRSTQMVSYFPFVDEMLAPLATVTAVKTQFTLSFTDEELARMAGAEDDIENYFTAP